MRTESLVLFAAAFASLTAACTTNEPVEEPTFEAIVERVFSKSCTFGSCHAAAPKNVANLDLTPQRACADLISKPACLFPDQMRVVPGDPDASFFFHKLAGENLSATPTGSCSSAGANPTNLLMPYGAQALPAEDLELVRNWIAAGAHCDPGQTLPAPAGPAPTAITASRSVVAPGQTTAITVELDQIAPAGDEPVFIETDSDAVSMPLQVSVKAGKTSVRFEALAERPTSRFALRARTAAGTKEIIIRVGGLEIAEVLADPVGADDGLQWVKVKNTSTRPINLAQYQLKAGQGNYDAIAVNLSGMLAPGKCAVIGGPTQSPTSGDPLYAQVENFTPDLPHAAGQAAGFAIFDTTARATGGIVTPVDTMLVGATNAAQLRGPDAEIANPYCNTPVAGTTALRTAAGACSQAVMQPRSCN